jgi:hypothetical protein
MRIADPEYLIQYTLDREFSQIHHTHQLNREEKDELLFCLVELLECRIYRSDSEPVDVVLIPKE